MPWQEKWPLLVHHQPPANPIRRELGNKHPNITIDQTQLEVRWQESPLIKNTKVSLSGAQSWVEQGGAGWRTDKRGKWMVMVTSTSIMHLTLWEVLGLQRALRYGLSPWELRDLLHYCPKAPPAWFLGCSSLGVEVESMSTSCFSSDDWSLWSSSLISIGETFSLEMFMPTLGFFRWRIKVSYLVPGVDVLVSVSCLWAFTLNLVPRMRTNA